MKTSAGAVPAILIIALAFGVAGCGNRAGESKPREFTVALTGYMMGEVYPCKCPGNPLGGLARRATLMRGELPEMDGVLVMDAGKWVSLDEEKGELESTITAAALGKLGVEAMNVTMRDARLGKAKLLDLQQKYNLPFLSANLVDAETQKPLFKASKRLTVHFKHGETLEVAVIAVCRTGSSNYMPPETGLAFQDAGTPLLKAFREVMDAPCVILLTDADRGDAADWIAMLEEETGKRPDAVLSSNMQPTRTARILIGQTPMTTAGRQGKYTDYVQMLPLPEGGWDIRKSGSELSAEVPDDAEMVEFIHRLGGETLLTHRTEDEEGIEE